jgi:hypothetical protein
MPAKGDGGGGGGGSVVNSEYEELKYVCCV